MTPSGDDRAAGSLLGPRTRLGRYDIIRRLAVGGMAELYLARHVGVGGYQKLVALKRVLPHLAEDEAFVARFLNEARLAATLDHSNIAHVIDICTQGGEHFMVMEYVHGRSAADLLQRFEHSPLPRPCALMIVRDVAAALHHAHERTGPDGRPLGLVHRDVSPSNVLVSFEGDVKLVDFGIAKATAESNATRTGAIMGKLAYMAPEQLRGQRIDRRADVFALCAVAYELMTGVRCFYAEGEFALINRVIASRFERPSKVSEGFPLELEQILARGLAVAPEARFADARELQLALEAFANDAGWGLSKVELSDHMRQCFGPEAYPTTDVALLPPETATGERSATDSLDPSPIRARRRRALVGWTSLALALGLGVGLATRDWMGDTEAAPTVAPTAPTTVRAQEAAPPEADLDPEPDASEPDAAEITKTEPKREPQELAPPPERRRARARSQAHKKPRSTAPAPSSDDDALRDFIPPSRREDG
jgi:serine/threonine protein kinase